MSTTTSPYYDQNMSSAAAEAALGKLKAVQDKKRSTAGRYVYKLSSKGEALVEAIGGGKLRVRLYAGTCPCK